MPPSTTNVADFVMLGFDVSDAPANRMPRPHRHDEIEMSVLEFGSIEYLFGGRRIRCPAGALCVRWGAIPHQSIDFDRGGHHYSLKIPLAWFLSWRLPKILVNRLLAGEMLIEQEPDPGSSDLSMMRRWHNAFVLEDQSRHRMILLEAEARLLRISESLNRQDMENRVTSVQGQLGKLEKMTVFIAANYTQKIGVADVASVARMHPNSAMRLFRESCGLTILEYLTMHRIWHAQHLLAATNMKIHLISEACGFSAPNRFYSAFRRLVGQLPTSYRKFIHKN